MADKYYDMDAMQAFYNELKKHLPTTVGFGTCATAAATATKEVVIADENWKQVPGSIIGVKFTNSNSASNVKIKVNDNEAASIFYNNAVYTSNGITYTGNAGRIIYYMFDGTYWVWKGVDWNTADGNTYTSVYCGTGATTAAKVGTCTNYYNTTNPTYGVINIVYTNTVQSALTLNINSQGAKPLYINSQPSSTTNYNLPRGMYIFYWDGTNYYINTDGTIPFINSNIQVGTDLVNVNGVIKVNEVGCIVDSANNAFAVGQGNTASGAAAFAAGQGNNVNGDGAAVFGQGNEISGMGTFVAGATNKITGNYINVFGYDNSASGDTVPGTFIAGYKNSAAWDIPGTIAMGFGSSAVSGTAIGSGNIASGIGAFAEGTDTSAIGEESHTEGYKTFASSYSHAEGYQTSSYGVESHSEGYKTIASSISHAEGGETSAIGYNSHSEGYSALASGNYSHAEGGFTKASGNASHAEGYNTSAYGGYSHAEGVSTLASGIESHAEGCSTSALGSDAHAEGENTLALTANTHAEGSFTSAIGYNSHAEGFSTIASGTNSHTEGENTLAEGLDAHAEGSGTSAVGCASHTEGRSTIAIDDYMHAEGRLNKTSANVAFVIGNGYIEDNIITRSDAVVVDWDGNVSAAGNIFANGVELTTLSAGTDLKITNNVISVNTNGSADSANMAFVIGSGTSAEGIGSFAGGLSSRSRFNGTLSIGYQTSAIGDYSQAFGYQTCAFDQTTHAEGESTSAKGFASHAEGWLTFADIGYSHAEGIGTTANNYGSHSEGSNTNAAGFYSHAEGSLTRAESSAAHAEGLYTLASDGDNTTYTGAAHAEGEHTSAFGRAAHAEGAYTIASSNGAQGHAEGWMTSALTDHGHTEGEGTLTSGNGHDAHAEGKNTRAFGFASHAEGELTSAINNYSHAEGNATIVTGNAGHAEGGATSANTRAHSEGLNTLASGWQSHTEGDGTSAIGGNSHAEGNATLASGQASHAEGVYTIAGSSGMHAAGLYNKTSAGALFVIGNGTSTAARSDALLVDSWGTLSATTLKAPLVSATTMNVKYLNGKAQIPTYHISNKPGKRLFSIHVPASTYNNTRLSGMTWGVGGCFYGTSGIGTDAAPWTVLFRATMRKPTTAANLERRIVCTRNSYFNMTATKYQLKFGVVSSQKYNEVVMDVYWIHNANFYGEYSYIIYHQNFNNGVTLELHNDDSYRTGDSTATLTTAHYSSLTTGNYYTW